jgi:hypothetical protein
MEAFTRHKQLKSKRLEVYQNDAVLCARVWDGRAAETGNDWATI